MIPDFLSRALEHGKLSRKQEMTLGLRSLAGDIEARQTLFSHWLRYVEELAKGYSRSLKGLTVDVDDLRSAGYVALGEALKTFDPRKGPVFSHIHPRIVQGITQEVAKSVSALSKPYKVQGYDSRVRKARALLFEALKRDPTQEEVAEVLAKEHVRRQLEREGVHRDPTENEIARRLPMYLSWVQILDVANQAPQELDRPNDTLEWAGTQEHNLEDTSPGPAEIFAKRELQDAVKEELDGMGDIGRVVQQVFGVGLRRKMTLTEISTREGTYSREYIRQMRDKGLEKLRESEKLRSLHES